MADHMSVASIPSCMYASIVTIVVRVKVCNVLTPILQNCIT